MIRLLDEDVEFDEAGPVGKLDDKESAAIGRPVSHGGNNVRYLSAADLNGGLRFVSFNSQFRSVL